MQRQANKRNKQIAKYKNKQINEQATKPTKNEEMQQIKIPNKANK